MIKILIYLCNRLGYNIAIKKEVKKETAVVKVFNSEKISGKADEVAVFELASTGRALHRALKRGIEINTVIDIGASNGMWSEDCMKYFSNAKYHLIDANDCHREELENFCIAHPNAKFVIAAAGFENGECFFDNSTVFGGVASERAYGRAQKKTLMISVDNIIEMHNLPSPYLLKLDTHGFEQSILRGAEKMLKEAELVVIESYIFKLDASESITFDELCRVMDHYGFRVGDFSEPMWREKDMMLWQWDLFFFRKDNLVFKDNNYA